MLHGLYEERTSLVFLACAYAFDPAGIVTH
jgi:hypothetical protein